MRTGRTGIALAGVLAAAALLGFAAAAAFSVDSELGRTETGPAPPHGLAQRLVARAAGSSTVVTFGEALRLLRTPPTTGGVAGAALRRRRVAELLDRLASSGPASGRSRAANLRGVVRLEDASAQGQPTRNDLEAAAADFARAVQLDPANEDAKYNLELLLTLQGKKGGATAPAPGPRRRSHQTPGGASEAGKGY